MVFFFGLSYIFGCGTIVVRFWARSLRFWFRCREKDGALDGPRAFVSLDPFYHYYDNSSYQVSLSPLSFCPSHHTRSLQNPGPGSPAIAKYALL